MKTTIFSPFFSFFLSVFIYLFIYVVVVVVVVVVGTLFCLQSVYIYIQQIGVSTGCNGLGNDTH
jgi:hypothetical protein